MPNADFDPLAHIATLAPAMGLTITEAQRPGVASFLALAQRMAAKLEAAPLSGDALEPAPVFRPGHR